MPDRQDFIPAGAVQSIPSGITGTGKVDFIPGEKQVMPDGRVFAVSSKGIVPTPVAPAAAPAAEPAQSEPDEDDVPALGEALRGKTKAELLDIASNLELEVDGSLTKKELIEKIEAVAQGNADVAEPAAE